MTISKFSIRFASIILWILSLNTSYAQSPTELAKKAKIHRGLILVIDHNHDTAIQLASTGNHLVHLIIDSNQIEKVRQLSLEKNLGGRLLVQPKTKDNHLPHPDRFVNLILVNADGLKSQLPSEAELQRVLAIRGKIVTKKNNKWQIIPKRPIAKLDGWFSHWYNATGNCVSNDQLAGVPRVIQWQHGPMFEDGTADGKLPRIAQGYAVFLDNHSGDLICRDAGNGLLLWRRFIGSNQNSDIALTTDRIHLWHDPTRRKILRDKGMEIGYLTALELSTGKIAQVYKNGLKAGIAKSIKVPWKGRTRQLQPVPWFVVNEKVIVQAYGADLVVLNRKTGKRQWSKKLTDNVTWFSPIVSGNVVLTAEAKYPARRTRNNGSEYVQGVVAFRLSDGKQLWRNDKVHPNQGRANFKTMSANGELLLLHISSYQFREGGSIAVLDIKTGKQLWRHEFKPKELYTQGSQRPIIRKDEVIVLDGTGVYRFNAKTGKPIGEPIRRPKNLKRTGRRNGACTASRATVDWLMANGWLYVGPDGRAVINQAARGACGQGVIPAHGMVFVPPTPCDCGDYLRGYLALSPRIPGKPIDDNQRLTIGAVSPKPKTFKADWPIFLGSPQRTSYSPTVLKGLKERWKSKLVNLREDALTKDRSDSEHYLGALSAPVVGGGMVIVTSPEQHTVIGIDTSTGKKKWTYLAKGKVDSPPTLAKGLAVFGCEDGAVYALRISDGQLVWRHQLASTDGLALSHGHLSSMSPIPGSVLILDNTVIAVSGHHTDLIGLAVYTLDLHTGKIRAKRILSNDQPPALTNNLTVADKDGKTFWIVSPQGGSYGAGGAYHLDLDLKQLDVTKSGQRPTMSFDRQGTRIRFRTNEGRGGSTHGWKGAMRGNNFHRLNAHRVAIGEGVGYGLFDPTGKSRNTLWATKARDKNSKPLWSKSQSDLGNIESLGAMIATRNHLLIGGGSRDGSKGQLLLIDAKTGQVKQRLPLPARVTECGLALANERIYICCEDGHLICLE